MSEESGDGCGGCLIFILSPFIVPLLFYIVLWTIKIALIIVLGCLAILTILIIPSLILYVILRTIQAFRKNGFEFRISMIVPSLTLFAGGSIGFISLGGVNILAIIAFASSSITLVSLLVYLPLKHRRLIKKYQENEQNLISL